jgi:hypothetical protein
MRTEWRHCGSCGEERLFEVPPCVDGHGASCPERACTVCGAALLVDPPRPEPAWPATPHVTHAA